MCRILQTKSAQQDFAVDGDGANPPPVSLRRNRQLSFLYVVIYIKKKLRSLIYTPASHEHDWFHI